MAIYDPYAILGVAKNCSVEDAKKAYRKLASKHHPDKGGSKEKFQEIKEAFELIERRGPSTFVPSPAAPAPTQSSFTAGPPPPKSTPFAGKPAAGYEPVRKPIVYPHTARKPGLGVRGYEVQLTITKEQAARGCNVPFWHDGSMRDYVVPAGVKSHVRQASYPLDAMIGRSVGTVTIEVHLTVEP